MVWGSSSKPEGGSPKWRSYTNKLPCRRCRPDSLLLSSRFRSGLFASRQVSDNLRAPSPHVAAAHIGKRDVMLYLFQISVMSLPPFTCSYFAITVHLDTRVIMETLESLSKYQETRPHSACVYHNLWQWTRVIGIISMYEYNQQNRSGSAEGGGRSDLCAVYSRLTQCSTERRRHDFPIFFCRLDHTDQHLQVNKPSSGGTRSWRCWWKVKQIRQVSAGGERARGVWNDCI